MELLICEVGKVYFCGSFTEHMMCIEVGGDVEVWDEAVGFSNLLYRCALYLRKLVGRLAYFPLNETFCPLGFFPSLACTEPLLAES
jgi:hypothetical protein